RIGSLDRRLRRRRAALTRTAPADADLPAAHARDVERDAAARRSGALLAVLPADVVHAGGTALLGAQDGRRVHHVDRVDRRLLEPRAGARDTHRHPPGAPRRTADGGGGARALRAAPGRRALLLGSVPGVPAERHRARVLLRAD